MRFISLHDCPIIFLRSYFSLLLSQKPSRFVLHPFFFFHLCYPYSFPSFLFFQFSPFRFLSFPRLFRPNSLELILFPIPPTLSMTSSNAPPQRHFFHSSLSHLSLWHLSMLVFPCYPSPNSCPSSTRLVPPISQLTPYPLFKNSPIGLSHFEQSISDIFGIIKATFGIWYSRISYFSFYSFPFNPGYPALPLQLCVCVCLSFCLCLSLFLPL